MRASNTTCFGLLLLMITSCHNATKDKPLAMANHAYNKKFVLQTYNTATFLSLTDVHLDSDASVTSYGSDTGDSLWLRTKEKITQVITDEQPKFMVYLGDLPQHNSFTRQKNVKIMLKNLRTLSKDIPILYLPGNNDALGGDYHSFQYGKDTDSTKAKNPFSLDEEATNPWPILNENSTISKITNVDYNSQFGFYAVDLITGGKTLKIIALNTVIFSNSSYYPYVGDDAVNQQDATQIQMQWFTDTLNAIDVSTNVLVMMHIPPGFDGYSGNYNWKNTLTFTSADGTTHNLQNAFITAISNKRTQIRGILTGHTHYDGLRRIYASKDTTDLAAISISTPGITVDHKNNPGFKTITYDTTNFELLDFKTYYAVPTKKRHEWEHNKNSNFKFSTDDAYSYTFKGTYNETDQKVSMLQTIKKASTQNIISDMKKILKVKSIHVGNFDYNKALDVTMQ